MMVKDREELKSGLTVSVHSNKSTEYQGLSLYDKFHNSNIYEIE